MKKIILIFVIVISLPAQEKYLVYFKDKGITQQEFISNKSIYKTTVTDLTERAIERRKRVLGKDYLRFIDLPVNQNYISQIELLSIQIVHQLKWFNAVSVILTKKDLGEISQFDFVEKIEKVKSFNFKRTKVTDSYKAGSRYSASNLFEYGNSFAQNELHDIPAVHDAGYFGQGVIIGFLDSGFDWKEHPALKDLNVLYEHDYIQGDDETKDQPGDVIGQDGHGTAVLSIGAGFAEGELIGPAYGASFYLAKTDNIGNETRVDEDNFAAAVEDFEEMGVDIITASLGYSIFDTEEESYTYEDMNGNTTLTAQVYNFAYDLGVVTVNAAGNEGQNSWRYIISPADAFNVIAVGNVNIKGILNLSSSRGPTADGRIKPEVVAMGTNNYHATSSGGFSSSGSGTSFSAPMVAGMIGQLLSAYPYLTNNQVRNIVLHSGDNFDNPNNDIGYGLMSAVRALNYPNVWESDPGQYIINKLFIRENDNTVQNISFHYKINDGDWVSEALNENGEGYYPFDLPTGLGQNDDVIFYYSYKDSSGAQIREPENKNYRVNLSENNIGFVTGATEFPDKLTSDFLLFQNYPNPFNPTTTIDFKSPVNSYARITVYNVLGQRIKNLYSGRIIQGLTRFTWNGTDDFGNRVASGKYFYSVDIAGQIISKKMILLK